MDETRTAGRSGPQAMIDRADQGQDNHADIHADIHADSGAEDVAPDDIDTELDRNLHRDLHRDFHGELDEAELDAEFAGEDEASTPFAAEPIQVEYLSASPTRDATASEDTPWAPFETAWNALVAQARREWTELPIVVGEWLDAARPRARAGATRLRELLVAGQVQGRRLLELAREGDLTSAAVQQAQARLLAARAAARATVQAWTQATLARTRTRVASAYDAMAARLRRASKPSTVATPDLPSDIAPHVWAELEADAEGLQRLAERVGLPGYRARVAQKPLRWASTFLLVAMLISLLFPALAVVGAVADYSSIKGLADSAVHHLTNAEQDISGLSGGLGKSKSGASSSSGSSNASGSSSAASGSGSTGAGSSLDPQTIAKVNGELKAAQQDFVQLQGRLDHPDWLLATAYAVPGLSDKMVELKALSDVGYDATTIGVEFSGAAMPILTRLHDKGISSTDPLITQGDWNNIMHAANDAQTRLIDISAKLAQVNINDLPLSTKQKNELAQAIVYLPTAQKAISQINTLLSAAGWLLGVGQARHFLVQTLDISELRASGGFTGNYGVLTIDGGKLDPFTLYNINDIEYGYKTNGWIFGKRPPATYSWWPFANWGLRDSNLSADFPTTAKINEQLFANEGQGQVDGVIQFSPVTIAHVLRVTGPIYVPVFNDTVTADNLQDKIHFYEEDPRGIAIQQRLFPTDHTHSLRKRFTQAVTQLLQDKVKSLPMSQLLEVGKQLLSDLQSRDLQIYVNNPQVESLLTQLRASGAIDTTPGLDGYMLVQSNSSVAKSTPYVNVTQQDNVTLDDKGGATHHLSITMQYRPTGPIYGLPTYRDYMRIYVPPQARLLSGDGFDTGAPLTSAGGNPYPGGELTCPAGRYNPSDIKSLAFDGASGHLDAIGGPTTTTSDVAGRAMFGGWVTIPQWCTAHVTLSWYVPSVVNAGGAPANAAPYTMLVQRQGGTFYTINVTVHPSPAMAANGMQTTTYTAQIDDSTAFTLGKANPIPAEQFFDATSLTNVLLGLGSK